MATQVKEGKYLGDWLLKDFSDEHNYAVLTIEQDADQAADLESGQLLQADSSKYTDMTTGSSTAAILVTKISKDALIIGDVNAVCLVRGPATVAQSGLTIYSGQNAAA